MPQGRYPKARWKGNGHHGGSYIGKPWRVVLHTTETEGIPGYSFGYTAPHVTYYAAQHRFEQHSDIAKAAARALRNKSGGVQTNRANAVQLEIVCYSAKYIADQKASRLWVGDLTARQLADIDEFVHWVQQEYGVQDVWPGKQAYSYAQANASGFRMGFAEWYSFNGVAAHQHVPENTHWDTGALAWDVLMDGATPPPPPPPTEGGTDFMFPIRRGDGQDGQRPEKAEDVKHWAFKMAELGVGAGAGKDGIADQAFLNAFFEQVNSPTGGSYISGEEGAYMDAYYAQRFMQDGGTVDAYNKAESNERFAFKSHPHSIT